MGGTGMILLLPGLGGLVLVGFGLLLLVSNRRIRGGTQIKHKWPATRGVVTSSSLREHIFFDRDSTKSKGMTYEPFVEYTYSVDGREYGTLTSFGPPVKKRAEAEQVISHFAPGATVTIYYNPENPGEEVVVPRLPPSGWLARAGVAFLLLGLASLACTAALAFSL